MAEPSVAALMSLFTEGTARVPEVWSLTGPERTGLWWRAGQEVVGTPLLLRLAARMSGEGERVGLLLATEERFRGPWIDLTAARLVDLGRRGRGDELCRQISELGAAAGVLRKRVAEASMMPTPHTSLELALYGAPADQPASAPKLLRVLGRTAALVEGGQGVEAHPLPLVDPHDPTNNWVAGRLIQAPGGGAPAGTAVLAGAVPGCADPSNGPARMAWVLRTPWATLLSVLAFTAEAWAAERQGGVVLELSNRLVEQVARPPRVDVVVTLLDGQEVLCGTLGELCLRALDALGMAVVPTIDPTDLDRLLGSVVAELLRAGVWRFRADERTRYEIGESFGYDCYRGEGHRHIFLGSETLSQTLRGVAVSWAKTRVEHAGREVQA